MSGLAERRSAPNRQRTLRGEGETKFIFSTLSHAFFIVNAFEYNKKLCLPAQGASKFLHCGCLKEA